MSESRLQQKWLQTDNGNICYFSNQPLNDQPTLVLLHGLSSNHTTWSETISFFQKKFNCLAPDLRGHGHSDKTKKRSCYRIPIFSEDLKKIIEIEKLSNVILVGYSFGGFIALDYTIRYPDSVTALVLISTNHVNPLRYKGINFLTPLGYGFLSLLAWLLLWQKRKNYYYFDQATASGYLHSTFKGYTTMPLSINFWMLSQAAYLNFDREIAQITCPTLIIKASKDSFLSDKEANEMSKKIQNSKLVTIDEPTHFLASRYQEKIIKVTEDFLREKNII